MPQDFIDVQSVLFQVMDITLIVKCNTYQLMAAGHAVDNKQQNTIGWYLYVKFMSEQVLYMVIRCFL